MQKEFFTFRKHVRLHQHVKSGHAKNIANGNDPKQYVEFRRIKYGLIFEDVGYKRNIRKQQRLSDEDEFDARNGSENNKETCCPLKGIKRSPRNRKKNR